MRRLKILCWHLHGSYLNNLVRTEHDWYLPVKPEHPPGYLGKFRTFEQPPWVHEVPADEVRNLDLDLVIYQTPERFFHDRFEILSREQQRLPAIYLEHNTPKPDACQTQHPVDDPNVLLVHVTHYNRLMWDNRRTPTTVIEHGVAIDPDARYTGELERGVTVVNGPQRRPRIVGWDIFRWARDEERIPLALIGMETERDGGLGDVPYRELHRTMGAHRFLFSPMRYTSLPLALIEALTLGMPVVALATTEVPAVLEDGRHGFVASDLNRLRDGMRELLRDPGLAAQMGREARKLAASRFSLERFMADWNRAFAQVTGERFQAA